MSSTSGGLILLSEMSSKLPPSERKIAEYILTNPGVAVSCTASDLAARSMTSSAAVIRLCKSLGLKGFQELKLKIAGDLQKTSEDGYRDIKPNEPQDSVMEKVTNNSIQAIRETIDILSQDELSDAIDALINAKAIHFFGVGASSIVAMDAQQKFLRINKDATAFSDIHMVSMLVANAGPEDVVFGVSFSGETYEVAKILDLANDKGAKTISLSRYGSSAVSERADVKLYTSSSKEATFRSGATSSRLVQLHVIDILFMSVAARQYQDTINYLDETRDAVAFLKDRSLRK